MPDPVRYRPDELAAIASSDNPFSQEELARLHPDDRKTYESNKVYEMALHGGYSGQGGADHGGVDWTTTALSAAPFMGEVPAAVGAVRTAAKAYPTATSLATLAGAELFGKNLPPQLKSLIEILAASKMFGGGGAAASETTAAREAGAAEAEGVGAARAPRNGMPNVQRGRTSTPWEADPGGETFDQVHRGVQNDFQGPVHIDPTLPPAQRPWDSMNLRDAYPRNIKTESDVNDLLEQVLGTSRVGRTPMQFEDPALRNSIDRLRQPLKRRTP